MKKYAVAIAGTTQRTVICAQALINHPQFKITTVITPKPKPVGRQQILTPTPVQKFADSNQLPTVIIKNKIDEEVKKEILAYPKPDFLLVVDFGYLVPKWLLDLPKIMPLNIHPSALPKWRGSSPGQFVLLHGEETSAVSMIQMTDKFDQGPIVWQQEFEVNPSWTQTEYYRHSFELVAQNLAEVMINLAENKIQPTPQPADSPTQLAKQLSKDDSFIDWQNVNQAMTNNPQLALKLERASRAYSPWPLLWTKIQTNQGQKRMQILKTQLENQLLKLEEVKIEGMTAKPWAEVKNSILDS